MTKNQQRTARLRIAVRYLLNKGYLWEGTSKGLQSRLGDHFQVSRQRVHQVVVEEREIIQGNSSGELNLAS